MGAAINVCLCLFVQVIFSYRLDDPKTVVSGTSETSDIDQAKRQGKQIFLQPAFGYPLLNYVPPVAITQPQPSPTLIATTGPCYNHIGELGRCVASKECSPYFKVPDVGNLHSWSIGTYDTCSYYTAQGRQMFGVCCASLIDILDGYPTTSTEIPVEEADSQEASNFTSSNTVLPDFAKIPNWPPPLPTHPPDHTIPPLPTHPPSPDYPGLGTSSPSSISTKFTTSRTTTRPFNKPTASKPISTKPTTKKPSSDGFTASCGAKNGFQDQGKIVGGHNAEVNEWPWIAALFNNGRQFCGGSLIDNIHILTAAHCVAHMSSWDVARVTVRLGDHNIKTNSEVRHIEKRVKRVVRHRGFDSRTLYNDIAILTLESPVEFSSVIRAVCLPSAGGRDWAGSTATVVGWGSIRENGPQPAVLQEVNIPIWNNNECRQKYGHAAPGGIVESMLCAGQANRDSCSGDSGGPLMVNNGKWQQVGIVSWGIGCGKGQYPGVYTRVEKFLTWIHKNLKQ